MTTIVWYFIMSACLAAVAARSASDKWTKATGRGDSCSLIPSWKDAWEAAKQFLALEPFNSTHVRETHLTSVLPLVTGFSIGLHSDHSHHHVLCSHIYGWHSPHGHLVLLDKGKQKASLQWNVKKKKKKILFTEYELFCLSFFSLSAVQNKTKENPPPGPSLPVYDPPPDCSSYQLHDLQPRLTIRHVRQPEVSGAGESTAWEPFWRGWGKFQPQRG